MSTTVRLNITGLNKGDYNNKTGVYPYSSLGSTESFGYDNKFVAKFDDLDSSYHGKKLENATVTFCARARSIGGYYFDTRICTKSHSSPFNPATICYNNISINKTSRNYDGQSVVFNSSSFVTVTSVAYPLSAVQYGVEFMVDITGGYDDAQVQTRGSNAPYMNVTISDDDVVYSINSCSPTSGYRAKSADCKFTWSAKLNGSCISPPTLTGSKFRWRTDSSATATEVDCGSALTYTLPGGSVTTDSFQWQCEITDSTGHTSTSTWYTISTLEVLSTANTLYPKNIIVDGQTETDFAWEHIISTGTRATKSELEYSTNGTTWTALATIVGDTTVTTIAGGTFDSGDYLWRVRTYNTDNNAGSWSDSASFTVVSAPPMPSVTCEQNGRPLVTWQGSDQQGYRVVIDDVYDSGVMYGTTKEHQITKWINPGTYTVKVTVYNSYGLYSPIGEAPLTVPNVVGVGVNLVGNGNGSITLSWTPNAMYESYVLYRDDLEHPVFKSATESTFTDVTATGKHQYVIRGCLADRTSAICGMCDVELQLASSQIIDLETSATLNLTTTDSSYTEISIEDTVSATEFIVTGSDYPIVEKSRHKAKIVTFSVAYTYSNDDRTAFESMFNHTVCLKTKNGSSVVGELLQISKVESTFYVRYDCELSQCHYPTEVAE